MTTQLFYFTATTRRPFWRAFFRLLARKSELKYMRLATYSALIYVTHEREKAIQACDLLSKDCDKDAWAVELAPEQMDGLIHDHIKGWELLRRDRPVCEKRDITAYQADCVLDRIGRSGLEGIQPFERRMLDRYAEQLRRASAQTKRSSGRRG